MILKQKVHFNLFYMGMVQNVNLTSAKKRDTEAQLIDQVEEAQVSAETRRLRDMVGEGRQAVCMVWTCFK